MYSFNIHAWTTNGSIVIVVDVKNVCMASNVFLTFYITLNFLLSGHWGMKIVPSTSKAHLDNRKALEFAFYNLNKKKLFLFFFFFTCGYSLG